MRSAASVLSTVAALVLALVGTALVVGAAPASAAGTVYTWRGLGDMQSWDDPGNWTPAGVPGNGDSATVLAYNDNICHAHVTGIPTGLQLTDLTVDERVYLGNPDSPCLTSLDDGSITVTHQFTFHAGTIDTPVTIAAGATGTVTPGVAHDTTHFGGPVTVDGGLILARNTDPEDLSLTGSPGITVEPGATLTTQGSNHVSADCCNNPAHVVNNGTLQVGAGTLDLNAVELDQNALVNATGGGQVRTTFAPQTAGAGARWTGTGSWQLGYSSATTISGTQTLSKNFRMLFGGNGSTSEEYLYGAFTVNGGRFEWGGGSIDAAVTIGSGTTFVADGPDGPDGRRLDGRNASDQPIGVTNHGTMTFSGGAGWHGVSGARLTNASSGTLTFGAGTSVSADCCGTPSFLVNSGGAVAVPSGTVTLDDTGFKTTGGTVTVGNGADLELTGGAAGLLSSATIAGGGTLGLAEPVATTGTETVGAGTTVALERYGALTTTGKATTTFDGAGSFAWTGGSVTGALSVATTGGQTVSGADTVKQVLQPTGTRPSVVTFTGPTTVAAGTPSAPDTVETPSTSKLVFAGDLTLQGDTSFSGGLISTNGTTTVAASSGPAVLSNAALTNTGALTVAGGTLVSDSTVTQAAGSTTVAAGAGLTVTGSSNALRVTGGTLAGSGQVTGNVSVGAATLAPGVTGVGTLTVTGDLTTLATSTVQLEVASATSADLLAVGGTANLRGTLRVADLGSYTPATGTTLTVVQAGTVGLHLGCTTSTGTGTTTQHWVARKAGTAVRLVSQPGAASAC